MPETWYIWDELSDNVRMEVDETGAVTAEYMNNPDQFGALLSQRRSGTNSFYHFDAQGSTRQLTDDAETVTDTYTYTAFGEPVSSSGPITNPYRYYGTWGYYSDEEIGEVYVRRRNYYSIIGRWLSADPAGFIDGENLYSPYYVSEGVDPTGELTIRPAKGRKLKGGCGQEFRMSWDFLLDTKFNKVIGAPCAGWIVQKVTVRCAKGYCLSETKGPYRGCCQCEMSDDDYFEYWEAWFVPPPKRKSSTTLVGGDPYNDRAFWTPPQETCGYYVQDGEVQFFCQDNFNGSPGIGDLSKKWAVQGTHGGWSKCPTSSGGLPSTDEKPVWWYSVPVDGPSRRHFEVHWWCCKCNPDRKNATAVAWPRDDEKE